MRRYAEFLLDHKLLFICILALISIVFMSNLPSIKINDNFDALAFQNDPTFKLLNKFYDEFGYDEIVLVAFNDDNILTKKNLDLIDRLDKKIREFEEVEEVISLTNAVDIKSDGDSLNIVKLIDAYPDNKEDWEKLKKKIRVHPIYYKTLISEDFKTTAIHLKMKEEISNRKVRELFVKKLERVIQIEKDITGKEIVCVGLTIIGAYTTRYIQRDVFLYLPFTVTLVLVAMFIFFRNYFLTIIPFITVLVSVLWTTGILVFFSEEINILTALVPTLIFVVGTSDCIHILSNFQDNIYVETTSRLSIIRTVDSMAVPCFLTSVTTMFGFSSLIATNVIPVQQLGIYSALGIGFSYLISISLVPILLNSLKYYHLDVFRDKKNIIPRQFQQILYKLSYFNEHRSRLVIISTVFILVLAFFGVKNLHIDTEGTNYFGKGSKIQHDHELIYNNLAGAVIFHINIEGEEDLIKEPWLLNELDRLKNHIERQEYVDKVISVTELVKYMNYKLNRNDEKYFVIPNNKKKISELLLLISLSDETNLLNNLINNNYSKTYLTVRFDKHDFSKLDILVKEIKQYIDSNLDKKIEANVIGTHLLLSNQHRPILDGLKRSFILACVIIFIIIWISFRSFWVSIISMIPNLLPIFFTFGMMGLFNIPLNFLTSPFACIGMGLAVDDTIHFLARFKKELEKDGDYVQSVYRTMESVGKAIIYTSIVFVAGFSIFMFSNFQVTKNFGALVGLTVIGALIADLFLLPVLLMIFKPFKIKVSA